MSGVGWGYGSVKSFGSCNTKESTTLTSFITMTIIKAG